jgi:hypothetical protein
MRGLQLHTVTYFCPDLRVQTEEDSIRQALSASPGIEDVQGDHATHLVRVVMANPDAEADIRRALRDAGFPPAEED